MKLKASTLLLLLCLISSCTNNVKSEFSDIDTELKSLKTIADKKAYLENIFEFDQKVRGSKSAEIRLKHGKDSEQFRAYVKTQNEQDALNLKKVERYFAIHGHPKKSEVGEIAALAPWTVIHHAESYDDRERNFAYIYKAYQNGDLDDGAISFYLGRMYQMKNSKRFEIESPYTGEDEIRQLMEALNLEIPK